MSIILAILGFGFLVLIHEFGHYLVARLNGVYVEEFSIGWGLRYFHVRAKTEPFGALRHYPLVVCVK